MIWGLTPILATFLFVVGTVIGSFLNVCIYRIPWQKSVVWPDSRCPKCLAAIGARDNVPILGWLALRGKCRHCGTPISARYPMVEGLVGLLFVGTFTTLLATTPPYSSGREEIRLGLRLGYDLILVTLLVATTFIDADLYIIPDALTVTGMVLGLGLGALAPEVRPDPSTAMSFWSGLTTGVVGLVVGGGLVWSVRIVGGLVFRREAMGFGDVTLMAMIGSFLGWRTAVLSFFLAAFYALAHVLAKLIVIVTKWLNRRQLSSGDRELPFGPYLGMAALTLMLGWPWIWRGWAKNFFTILSMLFWYVLGQDL